MHSSFPILETSQNGPYIAFFWAGVQQFVQNVQFHDVLLPGCQEFPNFIRILLKKSNKAWPISKLGWRPSFSISFPGPNRTLPTVCPALGETTVESKKGRCH